MANFVLGLIVDNHHVLDYSLMEGGSTIRMGQCFHPRSMWPYHHTRFEALHNSFTVSLEMLDNCANTSMKDIFYNFFFPTHKRWARPLGSASEITWFLATLAISLWCVMDELSMFWCVEQKDSHRCSVVDY